MAIEPITMRSITSRVFIVPIAGAAFLLVLATSLPPQIAPAWAADETGDLALSSTASSIAVDRGEASDVNRDELLVEIAPQPEPTLPEQGTSASSPAESPTAAAAAPSSLAPISGGASPSAIFADLNAQRTAAGLAPFVSHDGLFGVAQQWSTSQASMASMTHNPSFAAQTSAVGCGGATENVASAQGAVSPVPAWMASPPHRANILSSATHLGVGAATSTNGITYYTLNFASC